MFASNNKCKTNDQCQFRIEIKNRKWSENSTILDLLFDITTKTQIKADSKLVNIRK